MTQIFFGLDYVLSFFFPSPLLFLLGVSWSERPFLRHCAATVREDEDCTAAAGLAAQWEGRRVAVRAAAVEPALEGAGVRRRRADALGAGPVSAAAGRRRGGGRPAPPHLRRRRRAGRRRAAAVVAVAVEPAFLPSSVHVVGRHYSLLSVVLHTIKDGFNERLITRSLCHKRC